MINLDGANYYLNQGIGSLQKWYSFTKFSLFLYLVIQFCVWDTLQISGVHNVPSSVHYTGSLNHYQAASVAHCQLLY